MALYRKIVKWTGLLFLLLLVMLIIAWNISRAMYPNEAQRDAIALMGQQPDYLGKNAFALLWTLQHDVPDDQLEAVMAEDALRINQNPFAPDSEEYSTWKFDSVAKRYPDLSPTDDDQKLFCNSSTESCLSQVREDLDAYVALTARNQTLLDRIERLHHHDFIRSQFHDQLYTLLPQYRKVFYPGTYHAVLFAQGRTQEALSATCREMVTWRRLGKNSDSLISRLVGAATTDRNGYMFASMLSELPMDTLLPEPCGEALLPPTADDISICNAIRGEFSLTSIALRHVQKPMLEANRYERFSGGLMFDYETTLAMTAEHLAYVCAHSERDPLNTDLRAVSEISQPGGWHFACVGNLMGCIMSSVITPNYIDHRYRLHDYGAKLRVLGSLAWMRSNAEEGTSSAELLSARPDDLKNPTGEITFGPDGRTLQVPLYESNCSKYWSVPLPPALYTASE